jgi:signal transduction histidine kinase
MRAMAPPDPAVAARLAAAGAVSACVAHELRNLLAVAASSIFLARRDLGDRAARHLDRAAAEVARAQRIVDAILALARGEPVRREPATAEALIEEARRAVTGRAGVRFAEISAPPELAVDCDPLLTAVALGNLLQNAVDAARAEVAVTAVREGDRLCFAVEDDGPGVDPALPLFQPLASTKPGGTGLGLVLCRAVAEAHGGSVAADRSGRGGARFRLWLPGA